MTHIWNNIDVPDYNNDIEELQDLTLTSTIRRNLHEQCQMHIFREIGNYIYERK